jgi:MSHA pilin protein MshD
MSLISTPDHRETGFTLIELIITIIIMSFAAIIIIPYLSAVTHSPDPILREQAIGLGQAMMDEILAKKWDENSPNGGGPICTSESTNVVLRATLDPACTFPATGPVASSIGLEGVEAGGPNNRDQWDDVDDYNNLSEPDVAGLFYDQTGTSLPGSWTEFTRHVEIDYIASSKKTIDTSTISAGASAADATDTKRIIVTVTSPLDETFQFVAVSCNF